ncbi:MAG: PH domain-containing protein [Deltaproteobacteria bacterium]|nr:PH domain-containing protein [Deltaproteobacteria bacterium]
MGVSEKNLLQDQKIIYQARPHWAVLLGPAFLFFIGWLSMGSQGLPSAVLIASGFIWGTFSTLRLRQFDIILTNNQLLINVGYPLKRSYSIPLDTITFANFYQPSLGAILNFGKIVLVHSGTKKTVFRFIARPAEFVKEVRETIMTTSHHEQS